MANALYDKGREAFLAGDIDWDANDIKVLLVDTTYSPNTVTDQYHSIIDVGDIVATSGNLTDKTTTSGVADAADVIFTSVTGNDVYYLVVYKDTGTSSTSPLICVFDTATGIPYTPDGGNIEIVWDSGTNKIFKL